jgi:stearoyl-CoA desaturase (delta-9 desaturase)
LADATGSLSDSALDGSLVEAKLPDSPVELPADGLNPTSLSSATALLASDPRAVESGLPRLLRLPLGVRWSSIRWSVTLSIIIVHALALLAVLPWLFSWWSVGFAVAGVYVFGTLGVNIGFHRLLTHRSFKSPRWFEHTLTLLGVCSLEGSPVKWVANHRMHHQHSDTEPDPHSPLVAFLWAHIGWMLVENREVNSLEKCRTYVRDLCRDRFYVQLERRGRWLLVYAVHAAIFYALGAIIGLISGGTLMAAVQLGLSMLVWAVFVRTVVVWHITWSVNSFTHLAGYRNYETGEGSRNNWVVALLSNGEGWHNNHHADQRSAAHGHRWWEFDVSYLTILLFKRLGLATGVVTPRKSLLDRH